MTGKIHLLLPRLFSEYTASQLQRAQTEAQHLMQRRTPKSLAYKPEGDQASEQAKRTVLMERIVLARFENHPELDRFQQLLPQYPNPLDNIDDLSFYMDIDLSQPAAVRAVMQSHSLKIKQTGSGLEHETIRNIHPIDAKDSYAHLMVIASTHALIEFMYQWCLQLADKMKDTPQPPSLANLVTEIDPFRHRLSYHAEYLPPVHYFVVEGLITNPRTGFPFNIPLEYFPRMLQ